MTKEKGFTIITGGRSGKTAAMQKALDDLFNLQPMARVLLAKANGEHEIIEGTTYEDVTPKKLPAANKEE